MTPPPTPLALVVLLGLPIALPALGTDVFVPALPALSIVPIAAPLTGAGARAFFFERGLLRGKA